MLRSHNNKYLGLNLLDKIFSLFSSKEESEKSSEDIMSKEEQTISEFTKLNTEINKYTSGEKVEQLANMGIICL